MLKIDKKFKEEYLPNEVVKTESISPFKSYRFYTFENNNKAMFVELKSMQGCFDKFYELTKNNIADYQKHVLDKHNVYILTY
ncbi:MAG: hypothetical protein IKT40_08745 [Bacilli bacterium]|nr:hypothetical protein [Bacilli bacterium]